MKTKLVKILAIVATATLAFSVNAADNAPESSVISGAVNLGFSDQNVYRGADLGDDTLSVEAKLSGKLSSGLEVFGGLVTDQSIDGGADQYYISSGIASKLFELDVTGGFLHSENVPGESTGELFATASTDKLFNLAVAVYYELDDELWTVEAGVSESVDLKLAELNVHACVGSTEVTSSDDRTYYVIGASLNKALASNVDVVVGIDYLDADDSSDETALVAGLQYRF